MSAGNCSDPDVPKDDRGGAAPLKLTPPPEVAVSLSTCSFDSPPSWADPCDRADTVENSGGVGSPAINGETGSRTVAVWVASSFAILACLLSVWAVAARLGLPPHRVGTCRSVSVESVSPEDSTREAANNRRTWYSYS